jgi:HD-like signal output (HDOD) protein
MRPPVLHAKFTHRRSPPPQARGTGVRKLPNATPEANPSESGSPFAFLQELTRELSAGRVELPSFPEVVTRVQNVVADPDSTSERIVKVVGTDIGLVTRLLTMANSALLYRGEQVTDLRLAITRMGYSNVRTAALAYANAQLRRAPALEHIRADLERFWHESTQVAALAYAIARENRSIRADEAMLAGLVHNIGKVYIASRAPRNLALNSNAELMDHLLAEWHAGIGQAIVQNWKLSDDIATAIGGQYDRQRTHEGPPDLQDLLVTTIVLSDEIARKDGESTATSVLPGAKVLGLDEAAIIRVLFDLQTDLLMLHTALG